MSSFLALTDDFLRGSGRFGVDAPVAGRVRWLFAFVILFGGFYGAVMASFTGLSPGRFHQLLYVAVKVPVLLLVSFALCLPSFFVVNTVVGLRRDFAKVLRAIIAAQSCVALVLACLAPVTILFYLSTTDYAAALNFNGAIFAVAALGAQVVVRRYYASLIAASPRHRILMYFWFFLYLFVAMQMAWILRPFVGNPYDPVSFFREEAWGNAYVEIFKKIGEMLEQP